MLKGWAESRGPEQAQVSDPIDPRIHGLLEPEEIGFAFQRLVVGGESGQMLVVMPAFSFYWPDWNRSMIKIFSMICMFCVKVMRHPADEPILPKQMRNVGIVFSLLIGIAAHLLLSYLGC